MYCIESLLGRWSTLRRTRRLGIDSAEILLPREQRVVDLERAAADLDRAFHAPRRQTGVDVAERPSAIPGDEVEGATTKGEPREPEPGADHGIHVLRRERPDLDHRSLDRKVSAPALSSMSFRLPHFGLWTHDGQPSAHGQPPIMCAVSATQPSNCAKPRCVIPTPPGWPS